MAFLKSSGVEKDIPLAPFKGNRFNILFHNAAGIYFLYPELLDFFKQVEGDNQLMKVVHADLEVSSLKSGCRALGIIDKMITAPLWKCLNETGADGKRVHVADMSVRYERFMECCEKWARDASSLMRGEKMFEDVEVKVDRVYESLLCECERDVE
ncbi:hypothetical protein HOLleu_02119 [Holothuria leucospilota]|uniref:Uncharacterized protein n=1 Tax=Holothuria leucospilota TaxID=206669 RepID=A0A9Q1CQU4_HOLLE|nr:hypothetical protein HOLleu_02119 [Holothuria leucospilota]